VKKSSPTCFQFALEGFIAPVQTYEKRGAQASLHILLNVLGGPGIRQSEKHVYKSAQHNSHIDVFVDVSVYLLPALAIISGLELQILNCISQASCHAFNFPPCVEGGGQSRSGDVIPVRRGI